MRIRVDRVIRRALLTRLHRGLLGRARRAPRFTGERPRLAWACTRWQALASAVAAGAHAGQFPGAAAWGVFIATLVHKPADALTIVSLMLRAGMPRAQAHLVNLAFSLMLPAGVAFFFLGVRWLGPATQVPFTAAALAFSAGTFLCIALSDLLPELQFHAHDRLKLSLALLAGFALMFVAGYGEREARPEPSQAAQPR
jgi:zinc transporter ZupT